MTELLELRGVVEAAPDEVAGVLLDARPGGRSPLAATGSAVPARGDQFTVTLEGSTITVTVDRAARSIAQQGEWWYRGVTSVEPDERGSLVVHRILNVAPGHRWAVRFVSRGPLAAAPTAFARVLGSLGEQLDCAAYPLA
jgi:NaMN:DMB phosphoribosyltransferase